MFIMLNPSTADDKEDDPTIRRCIGFAKSWGFGGIEVRNLFSIRATNPKEIYKSTYPGRLDGLMSIPKENPITIVLAWGNHGLYGNTGMCFIDYLRENEIEAWHFGMTKKGQPKHPLFLPKDAKLHLL